MGLLTKKFSPSIALWLLFLQPSVFASSEITNYLGMTFVSIPAGSFKMGLEDAWSIVDEMD